jgi:hypothetical protein
MEVFAKLIICRLQRNLAAALWVLMGRKFDRWPCRLPLFLVDLDSKIMWFIEMADIVSLKKDKCQIVR